MNQDSIRFHAQGTSSRELSGRFLLLAVLFALGFVGCFPIEPGPKLAHFALEAPQVGDPAPPFVLRDLDGVEVALADFLGERPTVLQFGSHSCPVYRYRRHSMRGLVADYEDRVDFLLIYTVEAHPVDGRSPYDDGIWDPWINRVTRVRVPEAASESERRAMAAESHERLKLARRMLVDEMNDEVWRQYGAASSPAFVIAPDGRIALRQVWVEPKEMRRVLDELLDERFVRPLI